MDNYYFGPKHPGVPGSTSNFVLVDEGELAALRAENEALKEKAEVYAGAKEVIDELAGSNMRLKALVEIAKDVSFILNNIRSYTSNEDVPLFETRNKLNKVLGDITKDAGG